MYISKKVNWVQEEYNVRSITRKKIFPWQNMCERLNHYILRTRRYIFTITTRVNIFLRKLKHVILALQTIAHIVFFRNRPRHKTCINEPILLNAKWINCNVQVTNHSNLNSILHNWMLTYIFDRHDLYWN